MTTELPLMAETESSTEKFLSFDLGGRSYSLAIAYVREIMEYIEVDPIPMAPEFIIGAIDLRGSVIPVFDLAIRIGRTPMAINNRTCIVIVEVPKGEEMVVIGLKVDMVTKVLDINLANVDPVPSIGGQFENRFVKGLAKVNGRLLVILELEQLVTLDLLQQLDGDEMLAGDEVAQEGEADDEQNH